jgi:hypothetical protein
MSEDDEAEDSGVTLGSGAAVEGAPVARVASRLHWGMSKGEIGEREGDTVVRTSDGPRELGTILESVEVPYFESQREFLDAVREQIGVGPIPEGDTGGNEDATVTEE